ncbi:hypothetical protein KUCAC02_001964 [Chaenocephalus aceratus]|uniref:Uncharacterized protein n=1 Tax=Chaenocephalus aceratus TaxID=36190 RepID=A0ACB9XUA5_CHAAC|nr:hypothetical protein KUCAC02_001964 [Chaenocephalus aceratus]
MKGFDAEPFDISSPKLRSLQSGLVASPELVHDLETALPHGQAQAATLMQKRVFNKIKPLTAIVHRNKKLNFASERICAQILQRDQTQLLRIHETTAALWTWGCTPTPEDREATKCGGSEYLWSDYLERICAIIFSRHANASHIILVNDKNDLPHWTIM